MALPLQKPGKNYTYADYRNWPDEETEENINTVVQPDLSVICDPEKLKDKGCFGPPDIVVEILAPYTLKKDMNEKFQLYEGDILEKTGTITSKVLEGFNLEIQPLFDSY